MTPPELIPELRTASKLERVRLYFERAFVDAAPGTVRDLEAILTDFPADVLLADQLVIAASMVSERGGPPFARLATTRLGTYSRDTPPPGLGLAPGSRLRDRALTMLQRHVLFRRPARHLDDVRESLGLPRRGYAVFDEFMSPWLFLMDTAESFEFPRSDLPPQVHFIGALTPDPPSYDSRDSYEEPAWWPGLDDGRPVVLVALSTVANARSNLIGAAVDAFAGMDLTAVVATGGADFVAPAALPSNVHIEQFVPLAAIMPYVKVFVTNGGYGGVQMALKHGVPMVVAGVTEEKPDIAARVAWSGVGIRLSTDAPSADVLRRAVMEVLAGPGYGAAAGRIAEDLGRHDAPVEAVELLEELARTGRPVVRRG
ncbi:glycosyltransferase [Kutzneria chonburiensis]|uniref:Glycosyltransferase n=1 Tax=Kutzneria chonburiensis TaxID=1483604 RepID=A0ABV6MRB3_9PSEU|nr:nucleotide disphospho-sugar-binding domain-containing protein [Kutzneria chonburiensis]